MPVISAFYGIIVMMFFLIRNGISAPIFTPVIRITEVVIGIPEGDVLEGRLPPAKMKLLQAWVEIHKQELMDD